MSNWVRLWEDMPSDPKWRTVAKMSGASISEVLSVFVFMLVTAGNARKRGDLEGWDDEDIGMALDLDSCRILAIRETMEKKGIILNNHLKSWEKRQPLREDDSSHRVREWRKRQKEMRFSALRNTVTQPEERREDKIDTTRLNLSTPSFKKDSNMKELSILANGPLSLKSVDNPKFKVEFSESFWPGYPHKIGKSAALKAFASARRRATLEQITAGLEAYKLDKPDDRPWCNPATWLNQDRWLDQPAAPQKPANGHAEPPKFVPGQNRLRTSSGLWVDNKFFPD